MARGPSKILASREPLTMPDGAIASTTHGFLLHHIGAMGSDKIRAQDDRQQPSREGSLRQEEHGEGYRRE